MTLSIETPYTDTAFGSPVALTITMNNVNFAEDFRITDSSNGELTFVNINTPVTYPESVRVAQKAVENIYQGSGLEAGLIPSSKKGTATNLRLRTTLRQVDSEDATYEKAIPFEMGITLVMPDTDAVSSNELIAYGVARCCALMYEGNTPTEARINALRHGVLRPEGLL